MGKDGRQLAIVNPLTGSGTKNLTTEMDLMGGLLGVRGLRDCSSQSNKWEVIILWERASENTNYSFSCSNHP